MRKEIVVLTVLLVMIWLTGCARVHLGLNKDKTIVFNSVGGYASPERGLNIRYKQAWVNTNILLHKQLQRAIREKNDERVKIIKTQINELKEINAISTVSVRIYNDTKYEVDIIRGEFTGYLRPYTKSFEKSISPGEYRLPISWRNPATGAKGIKTKVFMVTTRTRMLYISQGRSERYRHHR